MKTALLYYIGCMIVVMKLNCDNYLSLGIKSSCFKKRLNVEYITIKAIKGVNCMLNHACN